MSLNVTLVVVGGEVKTPEIKLRLPSTVGRGRDCSIMLRHPLVSRQHCEIFETGGALIVRDLGSLNGTFVNNQRIEGDAPLPAGQLLTIGTVTFRAMYEDAHAGGTPPAGPGPQIKTAKPSSETDSEGTVSVRPSPNKTPAAAPSRTPENATLPQEPVDVDMDFDLDDAQPLFSEISNDKTRDAKPPKTGAPKPPSKNGSAETVQAPGKVHPSAVTTPAPPKPTAPKPTEAKPAGKAPEKPADKATAKPADNGPSFNFPGADDETDKNDDEDDLNDFLKNLK